MSTVDLVVTRIDDGLPGIRTLTLAHPDGAPLPSFTPGSHLVVECRTATGTVANAYSLTGESIAPVEYTISVLECPAGSGGSRWIHHELAVGDNVVARPPRSAFAPVQRARRHLLIAAGIGITPVVSHLRSARRWQRDVAVLYLYREGRGALLDEVKELTDNVDLFTERALFLAELPGTLANQPFGTHLYTCGPTAFMDHVMTTATELGWPASRLHQEAFGVDALDPGAPFTVRLTESRQSFVVESGVSLLEALEQRGHPVPNLCRRGVCGECRVPVTGGQPLHRDLYLTETERQASDVLMCCVSRCAGDELELNL